MESTEELNNLTAHGFTDDWTSGGKGKEGEADDANGGTSTRHNSANRDTY